MDWFTYGVLIGIYAFLFFCLIKLYSIERTIDNLFDHIRLNSKTIEEIINKRTHEIIEYQSYTKDCFKALASYCSWVESKRKKHKNK